MRVKEVACLPDERHDVAGDKDLGDSICLDQAIAFPISYSETDEPAVDDVVES